MVWAAVPFFRLLGSVGQRFVAEGQVNFTVREQAMSRPLNAISRGPA